MAVTNLGTPTSFQGNTATPSVAHTVGSGTGGVVSYIFVYAGGGTSITSMNNFGGVAPVLVGSSDYLHAYRVVSPAAGATSAQANLDGAGLCTIHVITLQGVNTSDPDDALSSNTNSEQANLSLNVASEVGDLVLAFGHMVLDNIDAYNGATLSTEQEGIDSGFQSSAVVYEAGATSVDLGVQSSGATFGDNLIIGFNVNASSSAAYTLTAEQGSYALTGQTANLRVARVLTAQQGSYTLLGQEAYVDIWMTASGGSYALTGQDASLIETGATITLVAESGTYTLTGNAALRRLSMVAASGSYALTGQAATLAYARKLTADFGSYQLSGYSAVLLDNGVPDVGGAQRILMTRRYYGFRLSR